MVGEPHGLATTGPWHKKVWGPLQWNIHLQGWESQHLLIGHCMYVGQVISRFFRWLHVDTTHQKGRTSSQLRHLQKDHAVLTSKCFAKLNKRNMKILQLGNWRSRVSNQLWVNGGLEVRQSNHLEGEVECSLCITPAHWKDCDVWMKRLWHLKCHLPAAFTNLFSRSINALAVFKTRCKKSVSLCYFQNLPWDYS